MNFRTLAATVCALALFDAGAHRAPAQAPAPPPANPQMQAVLDELAALGPKPTETLLPAEARKQPGASDAVRALLKEQGKSTGPEPVAKVQDMTIPGPAGAIPARDLPPATVIAAEIDPLRSEGKAYADKLAAAGVKVKYSLHPGVTHEFFGMGAVLDEAKKAVAEAAAGLGPVLGVESEK